MRIGIIGAGNVGTTLGTGWAKLGHIITYGVKAPRAGTSEQSVPEAVKVSEIIVLAVPWAAVPAVLEPATLYRGKVVIDCTNPINTDFTGLSLPHNDSSGEAVQRLIPEAKVVKAFNTCGFNVMADPLFAEGAASMLIASDDDAAKKAVITLATELGFDPVDAGPMVQARYMEAAAWLWISLALKLGLGREIAFRLMRR